MAIGSELVLVLEPAVLERLAGPSWNAALEGEPDRADLVAQAADATAAALTAAHRSLLQEWFGPVADVDAGRYLAAQTPLGPRQFRPMEVQGFGWEHDPHAVLGVSLWGRYRPVWCDWRHLHGGSGDHIVLDDDLRTMVERARAHLAPVIPELAGAPLAVVQQFY